MKTKITTQLKKIIPLLSLIFLPLVSLAQITNPNPTSLCSGSSSLADVKGILNFFTCLILESVVPLLIALAIVVFIYGVVRYMLNANDSAKREEGRNFMIWGIIALFVIVSIWGLVGLLAGTFGIKSVIPQLQSQ